MLLHKYITINAPALQVFDYWAEFSHFQQFIPIIEHIDVLDDRRSRWIIHAPLGNQVTFESLITIYKPGENLAWESRHADGFARGNLKLLASGENTRVKLDFEYTLYRIWMRNIARIVTHFGFPSVAFDHGLTRIKEEIEKGEF